MVPQFIVKADPLARVAVTTPTRKAATNLAREVARQMQVSQSVSQSIDQLGRHALPPKGGREESTCHGRRLMPVM